MASITDDGNGRKRIQFFGADGVRRALRLGKATMRQAEAFKVRLEHLVSAAITGGALDDETSRWLAALDDKIHAKLAAVKLIQGRERTAQTLKAFLDSFFASLEVKESTVLMYANTQRCLLKHFGESRPLRSIGPTEAEGFRRFLRDDEKLSDSTVARRVKVARQMFKRAFRWKLIPDNPFADVAGGCQRNRERMYFVTRAEAEAVLAVCPNAEWKLLFALSRYGGLRCPSEHMALKWSDVDFGQGRIRVPSPKTEHHEGKDCRYIPIFPELEPYLLAAYDPASSDDYVITRYRDPKQNLRTQLLRIIHRAGLVPWPKLWHNLRSSRQTELAETYPMHVVCNWIGNSAAVARDHYLQVTDQHFERARRERTGAAQNQAQHGARLLRTDVNPELVIAEIRPDSGPFAGILLDGSGPLGLEPRTF